jgi:LDH2 family malate/lactate/ureidoglycolate dehydrogenase
MSVSKPRIFVTQPIPEKALARLRDAGSVEHIRLPGEQSHATWRERSAHGIPLNDALLNNLHQVAIDLRIKALGEESRQ